MKPSSLAIILTIPCLLFLNACNSETEDSATLSILEDELLDLKAKIKSLEKELESAEAATSSAQAQANAANSTIADLANQERAVRDEFAAYKAAWNRRANDLGRQIESINLRDGRSFAPAMIVRITDEKVYIQHQGGYEEVEYADLPDAMRTRYETGSAGSSAVATAPAGTESAPAETVMEAEAEPVTIPTTLAEVDPENPLKQYELIKEVFVPTDKDMRKDMINVEVVAKELVGVREERDAAEKALAALNDETSETSLVFTEKKLQSLNVQIAEMEAKIKAAKRQVDDLDDRIDDLENSGGGISRSAVDINREKRPLVEKMEALEKALEASSVTVKQLTGEKQAATHTIARMSRERYVQEGKLKQAERSIKGAEERLYRFNAEAIAAMKASQ